MLKTPTIQKSKTRLSLGDILRMLVNEGKLDKVNAEKLYKDRKLDSSSLHPIIVIGEQKWKDMQSPHKVMSVDFLSRWLADQAGIEFFHIDPLKLDFTSAAQIISKAYAERLKIMPIAIKGNEATVASAEPFQTEWIPDLERALGMKIKLVMANPLEINRYLPEIYNLASSINQANASKMGQIVGVQNFEQLVELGKDKNLDANE
jgi:general secretion pathway protein E